MKTMVLILIVLPTSLAWAGEVDSSSLNASHRASAIALARQGNTGRALQIMEQMARKKGWSQSLLYDYVVVLSWDQRNLEAYTLFSEKINRQKAPIYVLEAMAGVCRSLKLFSKATELYTLIQRKDPHYIEAHIGKVMVAFESNPKTKDLSLLKSIEARIPQNERGFLALAKMFYTLERYHDSLRYYNKALDFNVHSQEALKGQSLCLNHLNSPFEAGNKGRFGVLSSPQIEALKAHESAALIGWGEIDQSQLNDLKDRFFALDRAIQSLLDQIRHTSEATKKRRLRFDLIVAYVTRYRYRDATHDYESLLKESPQEDIPVYVLEAVGHAYLSQYNPEKALEIFSFILSKNPNSVKAITGSFYALLESGNPERAMAFLQVNYQKHKKWIDVLGVSYPNRNRLALEEVYRSSFLYTNQLGRADQISREALRTMPLNTEARALRANVLMARGLPRSAEKELSIGLTNDPSSLSLLMGKARAALALNDPQLALQVMQTIHKNYPENSDLHALQRQVKAYHLREFVSETTYSQGGSNALGGRGKSLTTDNRLYSAPFQHHYRAFVSGFYQWALLNSQRLSRGLEGIGLEYRNRYGKILGEINRSHWGQHRWGGVLDILYTPTDHLKFSAKAERVSRQTPNQALLNNIVSHLYSLGGEFYANDSFSSGISAFIQTFSDQNQWRGTNGFLQYRLLERPRFSLEGRLDASARVSRTDNVPYYSPRSDQSLTFSFPLTHTLYERYQCSWKHTLTPVVGRYWQRGYGGRTTTGLSYEQEIKKAERFSMGYGLSRKRNYFDGAKEEETTFVVKANVRF